MDWWRVSFEVGSLLALASCLWFIVDENVRHAMREPNTPHMLYRVAEPIWVVLAFGFFFLLESWAAYRAPLYYYPDSSIGLQWIAHDWSHVIRWLHIEPRPPDYLCYVTVQSQKLQPTIPLAIPAMETAVTYAALRTARFLVGVDRIAISVWRAWWVALIAALICLTIDLILDPAVSTRSVDCGMTQSYDGAGVWRWIEDESGWFGVPVWNFAVWFAAPITGCAIAYAVLWSVSWLFRRFGWKTHAVNERVPHERWDAWDAPPPTTRRLSVLALAILGASLLFIIFCAHDSFVGHFDYPQGIAAMIGMKRALILATAAAVLTSVILWSDTWRQSEPLRWPLVLPLLFFIAWPLVWYAGNASLLEAPGVPQPFPTQKWPTEPLAHMAYGVGAAIVLAAAGTYLVFAPYIRRMNASFGAIAGLNDFVRIHYFSHTSMHVFLGAGISLAFSAGGVVTAAQLWELLGTALLFHQFMVWLNDWEDWALDRTEARRGPGRALRDAVGRGRLLVMALVTVPAAMALNYYAGGSWLFLAIAYGGMAIYNVFGKSGRVHPCVTDFIQGVAWGALVLYAANLVCTPASLPILVYVLAVSAIVYILLVNGYHGSMRDLANDIAHGKSTTAIRLGARVGADGRTIIPPKLRNVACGYFIAYVLVGAVLYAFANSDPAALTRNGWVFIVVALLMWNCWLMKRVLEPVTSKRDPYLGQHALAMMLAPIVILVPPLEPSMQVGTLAAFVVPFFISRFGDAASATR